MPSVLNDFFTGLQFLSRIRIVKQTEWSEESFGRSVRYFPLVGAIMGAIMAGLYLLAAPYLPRHLLAVLLIILEIGLSGGLHCDGFMDTADGIFSGRSRERMLEIMKDSRVGSNGVVAFCLLVLVKWSVYLDMSAGVFATALFLAPVISRFCMVVGITIYPYARPEGIGKAFAEYAGKPALYISCFITVLLTAVCGQIAIAALFVAVLFTRLLAGYITGILGGLTGDVYGAITETTALVVVLVFLFLQSL